MKHDPSVYAKAFAAAAAGPLSPEKERTLVRNLLAIVERHGDRKLLPKIQAAAEKILRESEGRRKVTVTSARPLKDLHGHLKGFLEKGDIIEEKVDPELVAGMKVTLNDERQFDGSLGTKLNSMFAGR